MLEQSISRLSGLIPPENILILTNGDQEENIRKVIGDLLPAENIIAEPEKRDTAPAIALAVGWVSAKNSEATMIVLPSDQLIDDKEAFHQILRQALDVARSEDGIVTIGIKPTSPCTAYGYIQKGERKTVTTGDEEGAPVYQVKSFREKPNAQLAEEFLEQGNYLWNAGIFVWKISTVVGELRQHCPELAAFVDELQKSEDFSKTVRGRFSELPKISIDYALMEKSSCVLNIEAAFDWDDLGNWVTAGKYFKTDAQGNACNTALTSVDSTNNVVYTEGDTHVALLGINDLVVVHTPDAILIAPKNSMDEMKKLVDEVPDKLK